MSVEARLDKLEEQHRILDANQHSLARVCADIKNIALTNQHDIAGLKVDVAGIKQCIAALAEATHAGFKRTDEKIDALEQKVDANQQQNNERFDQLELLIRQLVPNAKN